MNPKMSRLNVAKADTDTNILLERTMSQTKSMGFRAARATVGPFLRIAQFSTVVVSVTLINIAYIVESIGTQVASIDAWLYADTTNTQDAQSYSSQEKSFLNASGENSEGHNHIKKERERKKKAMEGIATEEDLKSP